MEIQELLKKFDNGNITFHQFCNVYSTSPCIQESLEELLKSKQNDIRILRILKLYIQLKEFDIKKDIYRLSQLEGSKSYMVKELKLKKCFLFKYEGSNELISDTEICAAEKWLNDYFETRGNKILSSRTFDKKWIYIKLEKSYLLENSIICDEEGNKYTIYDHKHLNKLLTI